MALSKKALQCKREKKKKKRQNKEAKPFSSTVMVYNNWAVYECWMSSGLWKTGLGQVIVSRINNQGDIAVGNYLIDIFCLGIKDCFVRVIYLDNYQAMLEQVSMASGELKRVEPIYANTLIHKAAEYASELGFKPHNDFAKAKNLLKNLPVDETLKFSFGKEGEPCYMQGPHESPAEVKKILQTLGSGKNSKNYHFLIT